jgi:hypothetical protein
MELWVRVPEVSVSFWEDCRPENLFRRRGLLKVEEMR